MSKSKEIEAVVYAEEGEIRRDVAVALNRLILDYAKTIPNYQERKAAWLAERAAKQKEMKAS